jgi:hypothetical protein
MLPSRQESGAELAASREVKHIDDALHSKLDAPLVAFRGRLAKQRLHFL